MATTKTKSAKAKTSTRIKKTAKEAKLTQAQKEALDTKNVKDTVKMTVESQREIKYNYPDDLKDQLERKAWRQRVRNKLNRLELKASKATGKEKKELEKALADYRKEVLMVP